MTEEGELFSYNKLGIDGTNRKSYKIFQEVK